MRLIGYVRTSVQNRDDSLEAQTEAITAWAAGHGHRLVGVHRDDGVSGALGPADRPGLTAALVELEKGDADGMVVHRLDRLGRALHVQEAIFATVWQQDGQHVFSAVEGEVKRDDPDDPYRTFVRQVMSAAAQLERGLVVARMQGGRKRRKRQGYHIGGSRPFGYTVGEDGQLVPVAREQHLIRRVKGLRTRGWTYARIADKLNAEGKAAPAGGAWYAMSVQRVSTR
jgi:DNA invertase Pin-like site-specific DNA recombinase